MESKDLFEISDEYHDSFVEYVEKNGFNESAKMEAEMKITWLIMYAKNHGVLLNIRE